MAKKKSAVPLCPVCKEELEDMGVLDICVGNSQWEMEVMRFQCSNGHAILIGETSVIEENTLEEDEIIEVGYGYEEDEDEEDDDDE